MGTPINIIWFPLTHCKMKADPYVPTGSSLMSTVLAQKCLFLPFVVHETGDFGLDAREEIQPCWVRMRAVGLISGSAMTARTES